MTTNEAEFADRLDRFLDGFVAGADHSPNGSPVSEPELAATVRQLRARDDAPPADPRFADRLLEDLMHATTAVGPFPLHQYPATTPVRDARPASRSLRRVDTRWSRWVLAQVATAALLVLILVGSLIAFGPLRPGAEEPLAQLVAVGTPPPTNPVAFVWLTKGGPDLPLNDPINPTIAPDGNLWVVDGRNSRFQIFAPDGTFLEAWGTPGSGEGQFDFVDSGLFGGYGQAAAVFDRAGNLYVADPANYRIQKFGPDRTFLTAWGGEGEEDGQFLALLGLAVDGQGRVYASDEQRNNVQVFDSDGRFLEAWGGNDADAEWLPNPAAITVAPDGNLWIVHFRQHRIQKVSSDGVILATWGDMGSDEGQFRNPSHVAVDEEGRVYVADWGNYRIQVFDPDGRFLTAWGTLGFSDGKFTAPNSLVLDGAGGVYVADDGSDRVQKFRLLPPLAPAG